METQVRYWMANKWTIGSNNEGLYNGINPSQKWGERKRKEKGNQETTTVAPEKVTPPEEIYLIQDQTPRI